jgi:hypothetical protein
MFLNEATSIYVRAVAERLRILLGDSLLGVYLVGSGAMGGFDPKTSDVDLAAVVTGSLSIERKREVVRSLSHAALPCPVRKLELVVYGAKAAGGASPKWELNLNTGQAVGVEASYAPSDLPGHWFVLDVAMAREHARPLFGPPPQMVFGEIRKDLVLRALIGSIRWHRRNDPDGVQSVLNACRAWRWLEEGMWSSKPAAARWARARANDPAPLDAAVAARSADGTAAVDEEAVVRFVKGIERRLERALEGG